MEINHISVPEQGGGKLIPEGFDKPGHVCVAGQSQSGMLGIYKIGKWLRRV